MKVFIYLLAAWFMLHQLKRKSTGPKLVAVTDVQLRTFAANRAVMDDTQLFDHFKGVLQEMAKTHPVTFGCWTVDFLIKTFQLEPRAVRQLQQAFLYVCAMQPMSKEEIERMYNSAQHGN